MDNVSVSIVIIAQFLVSLAVFFILIYAGKFIHDKLRSNPRIKDSKFLNLGEYLPEEEFTTIKQVFYLIMILIFVVDILYLIFSMSKNPFNFLLLDIIVAVYVVVNGDVKFSEKKLVFILLIPISSISYLIFSNGFLSLLVILHIFAFPYLIKVYYNKFVEYTETNSLGITILLLFAIVFVSFFITIIVEDVSPINSLAMVSNAFTSNGYSILGNSTLGKLNALLLVWSGFILSGVGTATLTVAIVMKHADEKFDHLEELIRKNKKN